MNILLPKSLQIFVVISIGEISRSGISGSQGMQKSKALGTNGHISLQKTCPNVFFHLHLLIPISSSHSTFFNKHHHRHFLSFSTHWPHHFHGNRIFAQPPTLCRSLRSFFCFLGCTPRVPDFQTLSSGPQCLT